MDGHQTAEHRLRSRSDEPGVSDHRLESVRFGKATDTFDEIAVAFLVVCYDFADLWNHVRCVGVVKIGKAWPIARRKFHAKEAPAALQDATRFSQCGGNVADVPDAEH